MFYYNIYYFSDLSECVRVFVAYFWRVLLRFFALFRCLSCACKGVGFRFLWAYFMPVSVRMDGKREKKKRAAVVVVRLGFCFGVFCLETDINNKGVALYGLRLAGLWLPRLVLFIGLLRKCR